MIGERVFRRSEIALTRSVAAEVLLARAGREQIDVLSGPGAVVWELLAKPRTASELAVELAELYAAPLRTVEPDVRRLLDDLEKRGWIAIDGYSA